jgi:hypothetical protein
MLRRIARDLEEAGLPPLTWYDVLDALRTLPIERLRQVDLAERVLLSNSGLSRLLDRIEAKGLVERARVRDRPPQLRPRADPGGGVDAGGDVAGLRSRHRRRLPARPRLRSVRDRPHPGIDRRASATAPAPQNRTRRRRPASRRLAASVVAQRVDQL